MIVVPARILQPPKIQYGGNRAFTPTNASWNLAGIKFYDPKTLTNWSFLRCGDSTFLTGHVQALRNQIKQCGLGDTPPSPAGGYHADLGIADDDETDKALQTALRKAKEDKVTFLFVILATKSKPVHARLKFFADTVVGKFSGTLIVPKGSLMKARNSSHNYCLTSILEALRKK